MRHQLCHAKLSIGVFLMAAMAATTAPLCMAQNTSGGDYGNGNVTSASPTPGEINKSNVPNPPMQPPTTSRPPTWPDAGPATSGPQSSSSRLPPDATPCGGTRIVARVGSEAILESDLVRRELDKKGLFEVVGNVDYILASYRDQDHRPLSPQELESNRVILIAKLLPDII